MLGVVKIGGAEGNKLEPLLLEIAARAARGEQWILVHGASGIMNRICEERGVEIRMITSPSGYRSRFVGETERGIFEEAAMTFGGEIREKLASLGCESVQIDPAEYMTVFAKRKDVLRESVNGRIRIVRGNYSGTVTRIDSKALLETAKSGAIPLMPPLGYDQEATLNINIDGDRLAASTAAELHADVLVILSNVPGLMKDIEKNDSLIRNGRLGEWDNIEHYAQGNMKRKMVACKEALEGGVPRVYLADGRVEAPLANALEGNATCLTH